MAEYGKLGNELGATVLKKVTFPTGQSDLTPNDRTAIDALAPNLPNRGLILVIGYASVTGNVDDNRRLSSARATKTAEEINSHKLSAQKVQAAYLGQTKRFSGRVPEKNQICEIWHILPPGN
jgi:outer membrane protein OmpA-like peptidoglycan-associated protein